MGFRIQQSCPQCGAPLELDETDRLINCPYCEVSSIISPSDYFRYVMHHNAPDKGIIYAPYLRFKGAAFYCQGDEINHRVVDISNLATSLKPLRSSLGVRAQTVTASFITPETEGVFLPINADPDDIVARAADLPNVIRTNMIPKPRRPIFEFEDFSYKPPSYFAAPKRDTNEEELLYYESIGETLSIVYLPLYLENDTLYDAIVNEPLGKIEEEDIAALRNATPNSRWRVNFLPILCPYCGWKLDGSRNSIAFNCPNCFRAWEISCGKLAQTTLLSIPGENENAGHLPFWKIDATCPGLGIESYPDLIRLEKPLMPTEEYEGMKVSFLVPAFKIAPKVFLTTAQRFTFTQHVLPSPESELEITSICAVTMPKEEAIQSIKLVLASGAHFTREVSVKLEEVELKVTDSALIFIPFNDSGYELSAQYGVSVSIIKKSLEMATAKPQFKKEPEAKVITETCPLCGKEVPGGSSHCPYCGIGF